MTDAELKSVRMTEYSHGSGCGCKIAPALLEKIIGSVSVSPHYPALLVGNDHKDDAAVYDLGDGRSMISTTDFFMPIVDDPFEFGQIAATNAISDIYAMGGSPSMAIAIFGWPIDKLGPEIAQRVIEGGRKACSDANIPLAGGHSIDSPEPIFGLAVTGLVENKFLKQNSKAESGNLLYLTKPLGIGILSTAQKKRCLRPEHQRLAPDTMCQLNKVGAALARIPGVTAMTDVTGFGLLGHLREMCEGSGVKASLNYAAVPKLSHIEQYLELGCSPGGAQRNFASYGHLVSPMPVLVQQLLCDPQTSGGLLVAVRPAAQLEFNQITNEFGLALKPIGQLIESGGAFLIEVV